MSNTPVGQSLAAAAAARVAVSRAEMILALLVLVLGAGAWAWLDQELPPALGMVAPSEERIQRQWHVQARQAELTLAENERKNVGEQLGAARLDVLKQSAALDTDATAYPRLTELPASTAVSPTVPGIPAQIVTSYTDARLKQQTARRLADGLAARLAVLDSEISQDEANLAAAQAAAQRELIQGTARYGLVRPASTLGGGLIILALVLGLLALFQRRLAPSPANRLVLVATGGTLLILYAYQAFGIAGAAAALVVVLLLLLPLLPRDASVAR